MNHAPQADARQPGGSGQRKLWPILLAGGALLAIVAVLSLVYGSTIYSLREVYAAFVEPASTKAQLILTTLRLPRMLVTVLIGANLGMAGALMQAMTRNPLASPSVFGLNAGAALAVVSMSLMLPGLSAAWRVYGAFAGALATAVLVYAVSHMIRWGKIELNMALIGVTAQTFLAVGTQGLLLFNESKTDMLLFWLAGSVIGNRWYEVSVLAGWSLIGLLGSLWLRRSLSVMGLGDELARGLGQRVKLLRVGVLITVVILAGVSVSIAGPIGFVGLIVPHMARYLVGLDYRRVIPVSGLLGALLLTLADVGSRMISYPGETPVGIVTALLGTPYFIYLARRKGVGS